jgi:predicted PurR-regulated permease PerM
MAASCARHRSGVSEDDAMPVQDALHPQPASARPPVRALLQIALVALLAYACIRIVAPFVGVLLWSVVLAVMLYPLHLRLLGRLGNRGSATLIGIVCVAVVLVPMVLLAASLANSLGGLVSGLQNHTLAVPPPPPRLADLPLVGGKLTEAWAQVSANAPAAFARYGKLLRAPAAWLAASAGKLAAAELSFVLSFAIAAVLVAYGQSCAAFATRLLQVVTGSQAAGARLVGLTAATIRGVAIGVVGVAAIQAVLLGAGFFAIGLPGAGVLVLIALLLGVVQVPATLLTLPVIAYAFATEAVVPAIVFSVWTLIAGLSDNVLKPLLLGRGLEAPMPVIFLGVIGGMVVDGLLGLFVGPVILAVGYVLFVEWLDAQSRGEVPPVETRAA